MIQSQAYSLDGSKLAQVVEDYQRHAAITSIRRFMGAVARMAGLVETFLKQRKNGITPLEKFFK